MTKQKLNSTLTSKQRKFIRELIAPDLAKQNLASWQEACRNFGPFDYNKTTRKIWFEKNKHRIPTGKKILQFYNKWAKNLRKEEILRSASMSAIRKDLIDAIREEQKKQGIDTNKLNDFKIATFSTLLSWSEDSAKLEQGPYEGSSMLPSEKRKTGTSKRGRKAAKGRFGPPEVELVKGYEVKGNSLKLEIGISNNNLHPFQNVDLELNIDSNLEVKSVRDCTWIPSENKIRIGFLPASLEVYPEETTITINLGMKSTAKTFTVEGVVHFDNTEKGRRESLDLKAMKIKI